MLLRNPGRRCLATVSAGAIPRAETAVETPYIHSLSLSRRSGREVFLKLDLLQTSGSFKDRGIGHLCAHLKAQGATKLVSSSGGNAGNAVASCGRVLGLGVSVIVPETTKPIMLRKIEAHGATVTVHGANWNEADALARQLVEADSEAEYVHPFDHELIWEGHSSLVDEIEQASAAADFPKPDAIVACVGGGGLLCGVFDGLSRRGWHNVRVVTAETQGAASFARSFAEGSLVTLDKIDSAATSLGALRVSQAALDRALAWDDVRAVGDLTERHAIGACARFADEHRMLVEPACGAALAIVDDAELAAQHLDGCDTVAVVVCGGGGINPAILSEFVEGVGGIE